MGFTPTSTEAAMPSGTLPTAPGTPATASRPRSPRETARERAQAFTAGTTRALTPAHPASASRAVTGSPRASPMISRSTATIDTLSSSSDCPSRRVPRRMNWPNSA